MWPGDSYMKPAEKIMSILNLELQIAETERAPHCTKIEVYH